MKFIFLPLDKESSGGVIQYPPFGAIPAGKQLFIDFELLEEFLDPDYKDEIVVDDGDSSDDDSYVDENAEEVIENNEQTLTRYVHNKRHSDNDVRRRTKSTRLSEDYVL